MGTLVLIYFVAGFFVARRRYYHPNPGVRTLLAHSGTPTQKFFGFLGVMLLWPISR